MLAADLEEFGSEPLQVTEAGHGVEEVVYCSTDSETFLLLISMRHKNKINKQR